MAKPLLYNGQLEARSFPRSPSNLGTESPGYNQFFPIPGLNTFLTATPCLASREAPVQRLAGPGWTALLNTEWNPVQPGPGSGRWGKAEELVFQLLAPHPALSWACSETSPGSRAGGSARSVEGWLWGCWWQLWPGLVIGASTGCQHLLSTQP